VKRGKITERIMANVTSLSVDPGGNAAILRYNWQPCNAHHLPGAPGGYLLYFNSSADRSWCSEDRASVVEISF